MEGWKDLPELILLEIYYNLSLSDRFTASSTCKRWRELLFHPNNWSHVQFDFSKYNIAREVFLTRRIGYFVRECSVRLASSGAFNREEVQEFFEAVTANRNLTELSFQHSSIEDYPAESPELPRNEFDTENNDATHQQLYTNCGGTKRQRRHLLFNIEPYIIKICANSNQLVHISLGYVPSLIQLRNKILQLLAHHQACSIKSLHLSQYTDEAFYPIEINNLLALKNLQHLSLNMNDITDSLLISLTQGNQAHLQSLSINVLTHEPGIRSVRDRTWYLVAQSFPNLKLILNLIRCPKAVQDMMTLMSPSMPLTHLRMILCDELYVSGLHHVARYHSATLQSFQIIESMEDGPMFYEIDVNEQDPFVMMAWRCTKLTDVSIIGVAIQEHDVLAIARLRGRQLNKFDVLDECITPYHEGETQEFEEDFAMPFESFCEEVSTSIGKVWLPLTPDDVHPSLYDNYHNDDSPVFLPVLLSDEVLMRTCNTTAQAK